MVKSKCSVQGIGPSTKTTAQHCVRATYGSAIGVDVHAKQLICCYQSSDGVDPLTHQPILKEQHAEFGTLRSELNEFAAWCLELKPEIILMESTGVLWRSPYEALEDVGFTTQELMLVNARDVKGIIGRKTDREDAVRLARIARMGIIKASFVPPRIFREMRLIARRYQTLKKTTANLTNVYQKLLNAAGLRASSVFSDVRGLAATAILESKLNDAPDFAETVIERSARLKAPPEKIIDALDFEISDTMRAQLLDEKLLIERTQTHADAAMNRLRQLQKPYAKQIKLLMSIPGIKEDSARLIFAELCSDLKQQFPNSEKFCSWLGICPGNNISANKSHSGRSPKGNKWLRRTITECSQGIGLSHLCLRSRFEAFKLRRGKKRAVVAIGHLLCRIIYSVLVNGRMFKSVNEGDNLKNVLVQRLKSNLKNLRRQTPLVMCGNEMIERDTGVIICEMPAVFDP